MRTANKQDIRQVVSVLNLLLTNQQTSYNEVQIVKAQSAVIEIVNNCRFETHQLLEIRRKILKDDTPKTFSINISHDNYARDFILLDEYLSDECDKSTAVDYNTINSPEGYFLEFTDKQQYENTKKYLIKHGMRFS